MIVLEYACTGKTKAGTRCERRAEFEGRCQDHIFAERAPWPSQVILELHINPRQAQVLEIKGIVRKDTPLKQSNPSKIFGVRGLSRVVVSSAVVEILNSSYDLEDSYLATRDERMDLLILSFIRSSNNSNETSLKDLEVFEPFLSQVWGHCHVVLDRTKAVHTVQCAHQLSFKPHFFLEFNEGLWGAKGVQ